MPHLNKQNKNTNPIIADRITASLSLAHRGETNKQTKTQHISPLDEAYTNQWTNPKRAETKRKKEFNLEAWEKNLKHNKFKKKIMKKQRNTTQMKEQHRNTEVQINEQELGKLPE